MNMTLWIVQSVLAALFTLIAILKVTFAREKLVSTFPWVEDFPIAAVRFIGAVELLAVLGLILPGATGIATVLTPLAAAGLAVTMVLAAVVHARRKEASSIVINAVLLAMAGFVVWGRFGPYTL